MIIVYISKAREDNARKVLGLICNRCSVNIYLFKKQKPSQAWWYTPVISTTREAEVRGSWPEVWARARPYLKNN
jgi:hypothetical protein